MPNVKQPDSESPRDPDRWRLAWLAAGAVVLAAIVTPLVAHWVDSRQKEVAIHLTVTPPGAGTVETSPEKDSYDRTQKVELKAVPDSAHDFRRWDRPRRGTTNPIVVPAESAQVVSAVFQPKRESFLIGFDFLEGTYDVDTVTALRGFNKIPLSRGQHTVQYVDRRGKRWEKEFQTPGEPLVTFDWPDGGWRVAPDGK